MRLVTKNHIERWASTVLSKADLPYLILRLIRATTTIGTQVDIPLGSASYVGGWDGIVNCEKNTQFVPKGISLYEFGTEADCKGKADDDYNKRTANSLGYSPRDSVFIFITPRFWKAKDKWVKEKQQQCVWKDVRVYDSSNLEQWLDIAPATSRWFAAQPGIAAYPFDGIMTGDDFWDEWSTGPNTLKLHPEVIIAGRKYEQLQLKTALEGPACIKGVKASTKDEAIAFIVAAAKTFPPDHSHLFFSKSLIVDSEANFRGIHTNTLTPLNLIPKFEEVQPLYLAVSKGHHVLVPLGADDDFNQDIINLPTIDKDEQINSLIQCGISAEDAEKWSRESGRNITILKKLIGFPSTKTKWAQKEDLREIIPALLLGRWNENFVGDIKLMEKLSGKKYFDYLTILNKWKGFTNSPLIQIGETWRLTSPLDLWATMSSVLTLKDINELKESFLSAFKEGNPLIEFDEDVKFSKYLTKPKTFSDWSREGLVQSLILLSRFGKSFNIPQLSEPQFWVDSIIRDLLHDAKGAFWISLNRELPLISEASPQSFLDAVNNSLSHEFPEVMDMFKEEQGLISPISHHTGLLWALEGLAWLPEYLRDASLILLKLSRLDPGGKLSNRPINSISEIFKPWHYQTLASYDERMSVLRSIVEDEKSVGWKLLVGMLPGHRDIAHSTNKMRWRIFDKNTNLIHTIEETLRTYNSIVDMLIQFFDNNEEKFVQLINSSLNLPTDERRKLLDWASKVCFNVEQKEFKVWESIRHILSHQRSYPDGERALPEDELQLLENLYSNTKPLDVVNQNIWLFNDHWPRFPEGSEYRRSHGVNKLDDEQEIINEARVNAIKKIVEELGLEKTIDLRKRVKQPMALGDALAKVIFNQDQIILVCKCLTDKERYVSFIHSFFFRKFFIESFDWIKNLFEVLKKNGYDNDVLVNVLLPIPQSKQLWEFIAIDENLESEYWSKMDPHFYPISVEEKVYGVQMLTKYRRFFSAIDSSAHFAEEMPSAILTDILTKAARGSNNDLDRINSSDIREIFESIEKREDIDKSTLIALEWIYLPFLDSFGRRSPKLLEEELTNNPIFFVDILKWIYPPKDNEELMNKEIEGISKEMIQNRARQASQLLYSWKKVPGMKEDYTIQEAELNKWITSVRTLAEAQNRLDVADIHIGQILARYPESAPEWPQEKIFKIIEETNSEVINRHYKSELYNKRGFTSRDPLEGGTIERTNANYFSNLADDYRNKFPNVAEIFRRLSEGYLFDAKKMDEEAERDRLDY